MNRIFRVKTRLIAEREDLVVAESADAAAEWVRTLPGEDRDDFLSAGDYDVVRSEPHSVGEVSEVTDLAEIDPEWAKTIAWGDNPREQSAESVIAEQRLTTEARMLPLAEWTGEPGNFYAVARGDQVVFTAYFTEWGWIHDAENCDGIAFASERTLEDVIEEARSKL